MRYKPLSSLHFLRPTVSGGSRQEGKPVAPSAVGASLGRVSDATVKIVCRRRHSVVAGGGHDKQIEEAHIRHRIASAVQEIERIKELSRRALRDPEEIARGSCDPITIFSGSLVFGRESFWILSVLRTAFARDDKSMYFSLS